MSEEPSADLFKAAAALVLFSIAAVGGLLPGVFQDVGSKVVSCLNTAAGGVFFASAMVHMLPESSETLEEAWGDSFPWGGFICALGFLLILCIDQAVMISNANRKGNNGHTLIPTEPPDAEHISNGLLGRGCLQGSESGDYTEFLNENSPRGLPSSSNPERLLQHSLDPSSENNVHHQQASRVGGNGHEHGRDHDGYHHQRAGSSIRNNHGEGTGRGGSRSRRRRASSEDDDIGGHVGHVHGHGHSHAHSHGLGEAGDAVWVRLALLLALSVHSVMEGLGVGAKATKAYNLLFAIGVHKGLAAYALGASLLQTGVSGKELTGYVLVFSAMTPVGILLGALVENDGEDDTAGATCIALAAGTFLYVSLMEVLPPELGSTEHGWAKMGSLVVGFFVSAAVGWLVG